MTLNFNDIPALLSCLLSHFEVLARLGSGQPAFNWGTTSFKLDKTTPIPVLENCVAPSAWLDSGTPSAVEGALKWSGLLSQTNGKE